MNKEKYLWITDTHVWPWNRYKLLRSILDQKAHGVFLTGDISNSSQTLISDLDFLGTKIGRPLYFVIGNHDLHFCGIEKTHSEIRRLCKKHKNLIWMDDLDVVPLNEEACIIGGMGWYDARVGNVDYLKYTFDWFLIEDFKKLPTMKERIEAFRQLAKESANTLCAKLEMAVETYKTIYLISHFPAWKEANRSNGWISDKFYEPYNTNLILGEKLEKVMEQHKKRHLICLMGHSHNPVSIHVSRNIECRVGKGAYHKLSNEETLYI